MTVSKALIEQATDLVRNGAFLQDAAAVIGCSPNVLSRKLRALGIDTRKGSIGNRRRIAPEQKRAGNQRRQEKWRENNREKIREQHERWRKANPEKHRALLQRWRKANSEKVKAQSARYYNHAKMAARQANQRARRVGAPGRITVADIEALIPNGCALCASDFGTAWIVDHKVALSFGGSNHAADIQLLCPSCNKAKTALECTRQARASRVHP